MVKHLSRMNESVENKKKVAAIKTIVENGNMASANSLENELELTARQVAQFLKRIDEVDRELKNGRRPYVYTVSKTEKTRKITYGDYYVVIEEDKVKEHGRE